jgi:VanZ family protein
MNQQTANASFLAWFAITTGLLLLPIYLPTPGGWTQLDKLAHFLLFFSGGWLIFPSKFRPLLPAMICWAILAEYLQRFVGTRTFSYADMGWNLTGLLSGVLAAIIHYRISKR